MPDIKGFDSSSGPHTSIKLCKGPTPPCGYHGASRSIKNRLTESVSSGVAVTQHLKKLHAEQQMDRPLGASRKSSPIQEEPVEAESNHTNSSIA